MSASTSADVDDLLPAPLRLVLYSPAKLEVLTLLEQGGPADSGELGNKLSKPLNRNSLNQHLRQLEEFGFIHVGSVRQNRGGFNKVWDLTDRSASWSALVAAIREQMPPAIAPSDSEPLQLRPS